MVVRVIEHNNDDTKRKGVIDLLTTHGRFHPVQHARLSRMGSESLMTEHMHATGYRRYDVENAGVDDYFVDPRYWVGTQHARAQAHCVESKRFVLFQQATTSKRSRGAYILMELSAVRMRSETSALY